MTLAIISHPDCLLHQGGEDHPEGPDRVAVVQEALTRYPFTPPAIFYEAPLVKKESLILVHDEFYVTYLESIAPQEGVVGIDADTWMNPHTLQAAYRAVGSTVFAVDLVLQNKAQVAFCNVRPPGHHAERDRAMGFCFFNNVAVGVGHALQNYSLKKIAIIDFDVHHGNGTQNIFQEDHRVLYCSSFQHPFYPGYEAHLDNQHLIPVPLSAGTDSALFREKVKAAWFEKITLFQPELIFFSAGFDAHQDDPLANLKLTKADYVWLTEEIAKIAKKFCDGKMISVLEGGYNLEVLRDCVPAHVAAMM